MIGAAVKQKSNVEELWLRYQKQSDQTIRETLITKYAPLVRYVAGRLAIGLPAHVDRDDLEGAGILGLLEAIDRFDPGRGLKFETYAISRIKGAMLDSLRQLDWVPRRLRDKLKRYEQCVEALKQRLHREPNAEEIRLELGLSPAQYQELMQALSWATVSSLDEIIGINPKASDNVCLRELVAGEEQDICELVVGREDKERLVQIITELTERERLVVSLYYYEGLTGREIARVLGISEARVSQLHTQAILRLRSKLHANQKEGT